MKVSEIMIAEDEHDLLRSDSLYYAIYKHILCVEDLGEDALPFLVRGLVYAAKGRHDLMEEVVKLRIHTRCPYTFIPKE